MTTPENRPTRQSTLRLLDEDWALIQEAAAEEGLTRTAYIRRTMKAAAKRTLKVRRGQ